MQFQFVIPCRNAELLTSDKNSYYVKQVYNVKEISNLLNHAKNCSTSTDPFYIFDHFDTFFSIIENAPNLSIINILRSFDLLYITTDKLGGYLATFLQNTQIDSDDRNSYLNAIKMFMFLITGTIKAIDQVVANNQPTDVGVKKGKKVQQIDMDFDWDGKRFKSLLQICNLLQLPLEKLWDPPVPEEIFVNMVCDAAYRTLEHNSVKVKSINETAFQILGTAIKRYNHALAFPVRILQILKTNETSLAPIAHGIHMLYEEYGLTTIFSVLIKDLVDVLSIDAADQQTAKFFSIFLTELGNISLKIIIPHISTLAEELLNLESYTLRNCVLQIMGDAITSELTSEELSEELKETRNEFLEDLFNHMMDVSAHVRSKVLQIWNHIKEENAVPLVWQKKVLRIAVERLEDKGNFVRKHAIILIKTFLERNPFMAKLSLEELRIRLEKEDEKLQVLRNKMIEMDKSWDDVTVDLYPLIKEILEENLKNPPNDVTPTPEMMEIIAEQIKVALKEKNYIEAMKLVTLADIENKEARLSLQFEEQCAYYVALLKSYYLISNGHVELDEEFVKQDKTVNFMRDSFEFSEIITHAVPKIKEMLMSKNTCDVLEAIDFFTTGFLFGIKGTEVGMNEMLNLVWSSDKEKRDAVTCAYKRVLFPNDLQGRALAIKSVKNISSFFEHLTVGHYYAMEVLMKEWVENGDIDNQFIQVLFERFTLKLETTENESRQALQLLKMIAACKSSVATANVAIIEAIGFEERGMKDPRIYAGCLNLLMHLTGPDADSTSKYYKRYDPSHSLIQKPVAAFQKFFWNPKVQNFEEIGIKTFDLIYHLSQTPDKVCESLLFNIVDKVKELSKKLIQMNEMRNDNQESQPSSQQTTETLKLPTFLLARLIFAVGYIAMKELIFLDIDVYHNLKYRQDLKEENSNLTKKNKKKNNNKSLDISASNALKRLSGATAAEQQQEDECLVGASAEDSIAELINHICENELLFSPDGIFDKFIPTILNICKYQLQYKDEVLQQSAVLCLIRFMSISSKFCDENMSLLMNILANSKNIKIKCNIVIGISDLTFRFPNVTEPWTGHFYSTLHEENVELRLTAVKMLSHLILHEMIRVKGQISDLAMCIVDENEEIRIITTQFFKEIANKSNMLYNVLPDIISRLSDLNLNLPEEKYRTIMKYIMGLIKKDKQIESLVEKLCLRFRVTTDERQWRDNAFCLSLLNYTEKGIKKLTDHIHCFKDKVQYQEVYDFFKSIIVTTSKLAKPELKAVVTEFEYKLEECLSIRDGDEGSIDQQPRAMPMRQQKPLRGSRGGRNKKKPFVRSDSSDSDSDFQGNVQRIAPRGLRKSTTKSKKTAAVVITEDSSSDSDVPIKMKKKSKK